jgi:starch phosphorylase
VPLYYDHGKMGFSANWVKMAKYSMATIMPRFNSKRMVGEYLAKCYLPASQQYRLYQQNQSENSRLVATWKARVRRAWSGVTLRRLDSERMEINFGESLRFEIGAKLNGLDPDDVVIELLIGLLTQREKSQGSRRYRFEATGAKTEAGEDIFALEMQPEQCGKLEYHIRAYPFHEMLTHPFEMGMMRWL